MAEKTVTVLLIEDDPVAVVLIRGLLSQVSGSDFDLKCAESLSAGLECVSAGGIDVILLDLGLPDSQGLDTFHKVYGSAAAVPIVILTGTDDKVLAARAVSEGAQDYLLKREVSGGVLVRAIEHAVERKHAQQALAAGEARFRKMINNNADGIVVVDPAGIVRHVNQAALSLFGVTSEKLLDQAFGLPVVAGEATEVDIVAAGGDPGVAEMRASEMEWEGEPGCIVSLRDITDRKRAQEALNAANAQLERKNVRLAELTETAHRFVDNVSHEFRTPLTVIKEFSEIIADGLGGPVTEEQAEYLDIIKRSIQDLSQMVEDLLDCSRLKAGTLRVDRRRCTVTEIMESVRPMLAGKASAKSISVVEDIAEGLSDVFADKEKAGRALINLAVNAIKFSFENSEITLWAREGDDGCVRIGVTDRGPGISKEDLAVIFGRFKQVGSSGGQSKEGFGLGLHIARQLAGLNLGQIHVESEPGKGSTFWFTLPRYDPREIVRSYFDQFDKMEEDTPVSMLEATVADPETSLEEVRGFLAAACQPMDVILADDEGRRLVLLGMTDVPQRWAARLHAGWKKATKGDSSLHIPRFNAAVVSTWCCPGQRDRAQQAALELLAGRAQHACESACH